MRLRAGVRDKEGKLLRSKRGGVAACMDVEGICMSTCALLDRYYGACSAGLAAAVPCTRCTMRQLPPPCSLNAFAGGPGLCKLSATAGACHAGS